MARSPNRDEFIEVLEVQAGQGASRDEILTLAGLEITQNTRQSVSRVMGWLVGTGEVIEDGGRYWLTELAPKSLLPIEVVHYQQTPNHSGLAGMLTRRLDKVKLPAFQKSRTPVSLTLYASPLTIEDVVAFELVFNNTRMRYPHDRWQVCIGDEKPMWTDTQESTRVTGLSFIHSDGAVDDLFFPNGIMVTIARKS
jgi:hypothetical protein